MSQPHDLGVGYAHDEFAGTTVSRERLEQLAALVQYGPDGAEPYHYSRPREDDDAPVRPCLYPPSLDDVLRPDLRTRETWDEARAVCELKACQIVQTGYVGRNRRATEDEREWAITTYAGSRAAQQLRRKPGTCLGCNSTPCRCWA